MPTSRRFGSRWWWGFITSPSRCQRRWTATCGWPSCRGWYLRCWQRLTTRRTCTCSRGRLSTSRRSWSWCIRWTDSYRCIGKVNFKSVNLSRFFCGIKKLGVFSLDNSRYQWLSFNAARYNNQDTSDEPVWPGAVVQYPSLPPPPS